MQNIVFFVGLSLLILLLWYVFSDKDRTRRNVGTILTIGITAVACLALFPPQERLKGGIDIVGGSSYTLKIVPNIDEAGNPIPISPDAVKSAMATIEKRLNAGGGKDLLLQQQGNDRIIVEMPGISEEESEGVRKTLQQVAKLEIRAVHPQNAYLAPQAKAGKRVSGYELKEYETEDEDGNPRTIDLLLNRRVIVSGDKVKQAYVDQGQRGVIQVQLDNEGGEEMFKATSSMELGRDQMASVLDGEVINAATVQGIFGAQFSISGMDSQEEARTVANALENPLKNPLQIEEAREVSARLGKATVQQGITAGIAGLAITLIFILIYYRAAGIIALVGLAINILLLFGVMAMFEFTFTLPGIAGIILTIGVAVDANVLIYERLREEMNAGKSMKASIKAAYEKAFSAIFDANITTLITALVLFWKASGTVKGFAITLTIGILASLLTALIVTRVLFYWGHDLGIIKKLSFADLFKKKQFPFMRMRKVAFTLSIPILIASIALLGVRGDKALGIDFVGGSIVKFQLGDADLSESKVVEAISDLDLEKLPLVQEETTQASGKLLSIKCATEDVDEIKREVRKDIPQLANVEASDDSVSATLGKEFLMNSVLALLLGLACIMVYITVRFEFSFALGAFAALFHDLLIVLGCIGLYSWLTGTSEFSLIHVGAILTIAGYSINDTIVVFDRIRETLQMKKGNIEDLMNEAINSTLSRTVLTSLTTFFVVLVLFIFGGQALKDFSFAILIGVIVGTYSSIFIASPIVYLWARRKGDESIREEVIATAIRDEQNTIVE